MNTTRILDILPASAAALGGPAPGVPAAHDRGPQAVAPVAGTPQGGGDAVPDAVRERVAAEAKRHAARRSLADEVVASRNMTNHVGTVDGSTRVFVDLLDARTQRALMRVFGPSSPPPEAIEPAQVSEAYAAAAGLAHA